MDSSNILDRVLTTEADRVGDICVLEPFLKCHHCLVTFEYVMQFNDEDANETAIYLVEQGKLFTNFSKYYCG